MHIKNLIINTIIIFCFAVPLWAQDSEVKFSPKGGVYANAFSVKLTCDNPNLQIRYTLNGATPDGSSTLYTSSLHLNAGMRSKSDIYKIPISPDNDPYRPDFYVPDSVIKGIVIRAAAFDQQGNRVSPVVTQSYFIKSLGCDIHGLPIVSICADSLSLFAHDTGILVPGDLYDPEDIDHTGNYAQSGREWERLINVEYYDDNNDGFNQMAGLRTHGGILARRSQQKGLKIYAREEYGKKNFKYKIFEESHLKKFKHLILRPFRNSCTSAGIHDWLSNQIAAPLKMGITASRPTALFLNGEYWGIYFIEEKVDERYLESHHGVNPDSVNIIAAWGALESGSSDDFFNLYYSLAAADLSDPVQYYHFSQRIDIPNIIDYFIFELFAANWDWPVNNVRCWQKPGGMWHWVFYDGDCCLDDDQFPIYENATYIGEITWPTAQWSTLFFRKLLESPTFKNQFLIRLEQLNKTCFSYIKTKPYLNKIQHTLREEIPHQVHRYNHPESLGNWEDACQKIDNFLAGRENGFWQQTTEFFNLGEESITSVKCYPNPASSGEILHIQVEAESDATPWLSVYDLNGRLIHCQYFFLQEGENSIPLNIGKRKGVYIVKVGDEKCKVIIL